MTGATSVSTGSTSRRPRSPGSVLFGTIIVASIVQMARGEDIGPFGWLGAIAAISYLGAVAALRLRG